MRKIIVAIVLTLVVLLVGCAGKNQATGAASVEWNGEVKEFTVRAFQFGFDPARLEVNVGDKVVINAYTSDVGHGLAIREFGVNMALTSKKLVTTEFIADKAGTFTFYCSIPCGRGHGSMRGKLVVNG